MDRTFVFLNSITNISEATYVQLQNITSFKRLSSNTQVSKIGVVPQNLYMVLSGIMRAYIISENGKEYNKNFFMANSFAGPLTALIKNTPSELVYETVTDCKVFEINFKEMRKLCKTNIEVNTLYAKILEHVFIKYEERQLELISLDASQRYFKLKESIPNIDEILPQYHIASYLSITPVQLSRIRKKIKEL